MNLDDETLLTAYLDGELDAAGRNRVEAATLASPGLARRLRDLAEARDVVESLSRPAPLFDVSAAVLARIASPPRPWAFRVRVSRVVSPRWLAVGSGVAAAASLLITISLTQFGPGVRGLKNRIENRIASAQRKPSSPPSPSVAVLPSKETSTAAPVPSPRVEVAASAPPDLGAESRLLKDQERLRGLLDRPVVRKIWLAVDRLGDEELRKLELAIERTHRKYPAKGQITVAPGVVIDPLAAQGAIVYALLLDEDELIVLEGNLVDQFGPFGQPSTAAPAEVLQLADQSHVKFDDPYGILTSPPQDVRSGELNATRAKLEPPPTIMNDGGASLPDRFTVLAPRQAPVGAPVGAPAEAVKASAASDSRSATVLIWLAPRKASPVGRP